MLRRELIRRMGLVPLGFLGKLDFGGREKKGSSCRYKRPKPSKEVMGIWSHWTDGPEPENGWLQWKNGPEHCPQGSMSVGLIQDVAEYYHVGIEEARDIAIANMVVPDREASINFEVEVLQGVGRINKDNVVLDSTK